MRNRSCLHSVPLGLAVVLLVTLAACGGGGGDGDGDGGNPAPGSVVFGRIQGPGSISVNGIDFDTSGAAFSKDGTSQGLGESDLHEGMIVTVRGRINDSRVTGTASGVDYRDNLEGPIAQVNPGAGTFVAMGQLVLVDANTFFNGVTGLAQLAAGNVVEVSGLYDANGNIRATYAELKKATLEPGDAIEVKGMVSNLDTGAQTFTLSGLTVDYATAALSDLPAGGLANGTFVEVESTSPPAGAVLEATEIRGEERFGALPGGAGTEAIIEALVTTVSSATEFRLNRQPVRTTNQTTFAGGTAADLGLNVLLRAEGALDDAGALAALNVSFEDGVGPAGSIFFGTIEGFGSVIVNGIELDASRAVFSKDDVFHGVGEADLRPGMVVMVRGTVNQDGVTGTASRVEYRDILEGTVKEIDLAGNRLVMLGQNVFVDANTVFGGISGIAQLAWGNVAEVSGFFDSGGDIRATYIEFKKIELDPPDVLEIKGTIANLDTAAQTFSLSGLTVPYRTADLIGIPPGGLANGMFVEVRSTHRPLDVHLEASEVRAIDRFGDFRTEHGTEAEVEGLVTAVTSPAELEVNAQPVRITDQTAFEGGTSADLALNRRLEVEGTLDDSGVLVAQQVRFEDSQP
ncbi:MAG: DUF5666 domain-containing protein [bacterium]